MDELHDKLLLNLNDEFTDWDKEFYVSISKAAELSGLSVSQIRYFENLCKNHGVAIGRREGPNDRNRVYTNRDVQLLRRVYHCSDSKMADIAQFIQEHQQEVLESLGDLTLPQLLKYEQSIAGRDVLIIRLVAILLSLWSEATQPANATFKGVIFAPKKDEWKSSFEATVQQKRSIDLTHALVAYRVDAEKKQMGDFKVFFSHQSWYLPFSEELDFDTKSLGDKNIPFTIVVLWTRPNQKTPIQKAHTILLDKPKKILSHMLLHSLKCVLEEAALLSNAPISIYSRAEIGTMEVSQGLSLLLQHCILSFFPDCYSYVAMLRKDDSVQVLKECGDINLGYTHQMLNQQNILDTRKTPWWTTFVKQQVAIALDQDAARRPDRREEQGSVVCLPLIRQGTLLGLLGIENPYTDPSRHCLSTRNGIDGPARLRYLICIAEIAAHYLDQREGINEKAERSRLAFTRNETTEWYWSIYQQGGINYTSTVQSILDWIKKIDLPATENVSVVIVDIAGENELARDHRGFDIIVDLVQNTRKRIQLIIQNDPVASALKSNDHLHLLDIPVADHLVLVVTGAEMPYLRVFLERIRRIWRNTNDSFTWDGKEVPVSLQVGICTFARLGSFESGQAAELMKHHLWELYHRMAVPSEQIFEYYGEVTTYTIR